MANKRNTDQNERSWFRADRFFKNDGKWYFNTREGTTEGPFWELADAEDKLLEYIRIMNSGFMPKNSTLQMEPFSLEDKKE